MQTRLATIANLGVLELKNPSRPVPLLLLEATGVDCHFNVVSTATTQRFPAASR
jgi:hypothetical protein